MTIDRKPELGNNPIQQGFWAPSRQWTVDNFLLPIKRDLHERKNTGRFDGLTPAVAEFKAWIDATPKIKHLLQAALAQANAFIIFTQQDNLDQIIDDGDYAKVLGYDELFEMLSLIVSTSPAFNNTAMVGTPINALLAVTMGTFAGNGFLKPNQEPVYGLFHNAEFNLQLKKVLDSWNTFLKSPASLDKLDINDPEKEGSWISLAAHDAGVWQDMVYDAEAPAYGYDSWNSFFIRQFVPGARPFQGDPDRVINIGCETTPWEYQNDLAKSTNFNVKSMPYSLVDIFGGNEQWADTFAGGQAYQGFLSATHYHRWQAPLNGKIVRSWVQQGTYFAQRPGQGEDSGTWEGTESQPYLAEVATRAIFIMEHEHFGYIALICIGMVEVSTCHINEPYIVGEGDPAVTIERGDAIGHFEFGGSTHMMIFQKDRAKLEEWAHDAQNFRNLTAPISLGSVIATLPD